MVARFTRLAYTRTSHNRLGAIWRYDVATGAKRRLTAEQFNSATPVFARDSLFFISNRDFTSMQYDYSASASPTARPRRS